MENFFFFVGLSFILVHEMDAIRCQEWTIFPFISRLNEKMGYFVFTAIHVPLYLLLLRMLFDKNGLNSNLILGLDIFFVAHVFLHVLFLRHPRNQFKSAFSWIIILGAGVAGALDLIARDSLIG
jgi:hypothetical protein